jgi:hypothetical protein
LNTIAQAGATPSTPLPVPASGTDTETQAQQTTDQAVVGTLPSDSSASAVYNSSGTVASSNLSSNWATILKSNPTYASSVINYSLMQGIVGSLSVLA